MYNAYVTKIKNIRDHSNADRLNIGTCFGNYVVIPKDYNEEDLYVYFPTDGQLSEDYANTNNLVRRKDEHGNNVGGYLDPDKRNIKAIKLRGERSDGLVMPIDSLSSFGDISILNEGDIVSVFNGVEIAKKYIPRGRHGAGTGAQTPKKIKTVSYPTFAEHKDTEQLAYNIGQIREGSECVITGKLHGCFISGTKVRMADNSLKEIQKIKIGDEVLGYNHLTKKFESTKVLQVFKNSKSSNWRKLKFSRNGISGDKRGVTICTYNHPYWVEQLQKYVKAEQLKVGSKISNLFPSPILTDMVKEICIGQLLGDGSLLTFHNKVVEIQGSSKEEHIEYQQYLQEITNNFYSINNKKYISCYGTTMVRGRTRRSADLFNYLKDVSTFDNNGERKLKQGIINKFSPLSLAIFYMEDGSLAHSDRQRDRANFAVCDYQKDDVDLICECFEKFNIFPIPYQDTNGYWRIRLNTIEAYKMFDLISEWIPAVMRYKLPKEYRSNEYHIPVDTKKCYDSYVFSEQEILLNEEVRETYVEYDMETELHNYVVGLSLVHNTSGRTGHLEKVEIIPRKWYEKLFRRPARIRKSFEYVTGTRRVVLDNGKKDGYYDSNFRDKWHDFFVGKLNVGETVYYEIVGFTEPNSPIMATCSNKKLNDKEFVKRYGENTVFSYGCNAEMGENDMYIYRMTMTNTDGYVVEYPWDLVKLRAEEMGAKVVPELTRVYFNDVTKPVEVMQDELMQLAEDLVDGPDWIDQRHIREGVVIRINNSPTFKAFKYKSFSFKVIEGIIKESAVEPDMEEAQEGE